MPSFRRQQIIDTAAIVGRKLGLKIRDLPKFEGIISNHCLEQNCLPETYAETLLAARWSTTLWQTLIEKLTVDESYFFRDQAQLALLEHHVLPRLIRDQRSKMTLDIWSAGCSNGQEIYTLVAIIRRLIPDINQWQIVVRGTDLSARAIRRAREGIYSDWSFRRSSASFRAQYFDQAADGWRVNQALRDVAKFETGNLIERNLPETTYDLVICRNVFIYLIEDAVQVAMANIVKSLRAGSILVTGHSELMGRPLPELKVHSFQGSVIYEKTIPGVKAPASQTKLPLVNISQLAHHPITGQTPQGSLTRKSKEETAPQSSNLELVTRFENEMKSAVAAADSGDYQQTIKHADAASSINRLSHEPYYLKSLVAQLTGDSVKAREYLEKVIYLREDFVPAYLDLAGLLEDAGEAKRAAGLNRTALRLANQYPKDAEIEPLQGIKAGELAEHLESLLKKR